MPLPALANPHISWGLVQKAGEAGLTIYKNRKGIAEGWDSALAFLFGKKRRLLIVGAEGAGKSVLADYMAGKGLSPKYLVPKRSIRVEKERSQTEHLRLELSIIPGQKLKAHYDGKDAAYAGDKALDAVIHVFANGWLDPDRLAPGDALGSSPFMAYRLASLNHELRMLEDTCEDLKRHWSHHHQPINFAIAFSKIDLYHEELSTIHDFIEAEIRPRIQDLIHHVGAQNISVEALPVATHIDEFRFANDVFQPQFGLTIRNAYLNQFGARLVDLLG